MIHDINTIVSWGLAVDDLDRITMFTLRVSLTLLVIQVCAATTYLDCPGEPRFLGVTLSGCDEQPCELPSGTTVTFGLTMKAHHNITSMKAKIMAHAMGTDVNYPLPNDDVCAGLVYAECPLDEGEVVNYQLLFPILESFPAVPCVATFRVVSDQGTEGCMKLSLKVVKN